MRKATLDSDYGFWIQGFESQQNQESNVDEFSEQFSVSDKFLASLQYARRSTCEMKKSKLG